MLKFSNANAKIEALKNDAELSEYLTDKRKVYSLDLLSGYSCPFAEACLSKAVVQPNTISLLFSFTRSTVHQRVQSTQT